MQAPSYDPTAWLIWGRELSDGTLHTLGGPSWKPVPVAFTAVFAFAGDEAAPLLWLAVARTGGVAAIVLAFLVGRRLGGPRAGALAAAGLALATGFLWNCLRGDSEGLIVAFALGAVLAHLDGRTWLAFALLALVGGLRPEVWPVLAGYGAWLSWRDRRALTTVAVAATGLALLAAWFLPDKLTTGNWLQGAQRAFYPVPGTPAQSPFPFGMAFVFAAAFLPWPLYAGAVAAVRSGEPRLRVLAALAAVVMTTVAVLAEFGFTGNLRYATLPGAALAVVGAAGLPGLWTRLRGPLRALFAAGTVAAVVASLFLLGGRVAGELTEDRVMGAPLDRALAAAPDCRPVASTPYERQVIAYRLGIGPRFVSTQTIERGVAFVRRGEQVTGGIAGLPVIATTPDWIVRSSC
ncbi:MAG: hypothetical protein WKF94_12765 [Solirubrobacteraceae bacterium]